MAQWLGQFSGNTHLSKVKDREVQLQHSVEILKSKQSQPERDQYRKTVLRFADQLLNARVRARKALIAAIDPRNVEAVEKAQGELAKMSTEGVAKILREFGADDANE